MSRVDAALRRIASSLMDPQTLERVFDAAIADIRFESDTAASAPAARRWWIVVRGYFGVLRLLAVHLVWTACVALKELSDDEWQTLKRVARVTAGAVLTFTIFLVSPPALKWVESDHTRWVAYLIPQALPLSLPLGLLVGIVAAHRSGRGSTAWISIAALVMSLASFAVLGWVMPNANQAFRETIAGRQLAKGINELTMPELRLVAADPTSAPVLGRPDRVRLQYHQRWAIALTPLLFATFALVIVRRQYRIARRIVLSATGLAIYATLLIGASAVQSSIATSAVLAAWLPNILIGAIAVSMWRTPISSARRSQKHGRA